MIVKSFLDFKYSLKTFFKFTSKEILSDLSFRKNASFKKRNLINIIGYRFSKNLGQYLAPKLNEITPFPLKERS